MKFFCVSCGLKWKNCVMWNPPYPMLPSMPNWCDSVPRRQNERDTMLSEPYCFLSSICVNASQVTGWFSSMSGLSAERMGR